MEPTKKGASQIYEVTENSTAGDIETKLKMLALSDIEGERLDWAEKLQKNLMKVPEFGAIGLALEKIVSLSDSKERQKEIKKLSDINQLRALLEQQKAILTFETSLAQLQKVSAEMGSLMNGIMLALKIEDRGERDKLIGEVEGVAKDGNYLAKWDEVITKANDCLGKIDKSKLSEPDRKIIQEVTSKGDGIKRGLKALKITASSDTLERLKELKKQVDEYRHSFAHWIKSAFSTLTGGAYGYRKDYEKGQKWISDTLKTIEENPLGDVKKTQATLDKVAAKGEWRDKFEKMAELEEEIKDTETTAHRR